MAGPRHIVRFESVDGLTVVTLPMARAEIESSQELRNALAVAVGMDYAVDLHGTGRAPLGTGRERLRALLAADDATAFDTDADALRADIYSIGRGKLYSADDDGTERWSWARPRAMPDIQLSSRADRLAPVVIEFDRLSDWYDDTQTSIVTALTTDPQTIAVTNSGNADVRAITFLLESGSAGGFDGPSVSHALTGETWTSTRTAAGALDQLRVNAGAYTVEYTDDDGATWSDDYALFSTGSVQVGFMRFLPGAQSIEVRGCTNATLTISFYPAFR